VVVLVVALVSVIDRVTSSWDEVHDAIEGAALAWLVAGAGLAALAMVAIAIPWRFAVRLVGGRLPLGQTIACYFVGELAKYVPGGLWPILGRGELAVRAGTPRAASYASVGLSLAAVYTCNAAMCVVLLAGRTGSQTTAVAAPVALLLGLALLHPAVLRRGVALLEWVARRPIDVPVPSWSSSVRLVVAYVPAWLLVGTATWAVARALAPGTAWIDVAGAATLSWLVGFLLVPVPGGVGVREAAFVVAADSLDPAIAAATALVVRLLFMAVDAVGAAIGSTTAVRTRPSGRRSIGLGARDHDGPGER
jgi:uncharacterized membrane protein YbhN (UPF0104 family)